MKVRTEFDEYVLLAKYNNIVVLQGQDNDGPYTLIRTFAEVAERTDGETLAEAMTYAPECWPVVEVAEANYPGDTTHDLLYGSEYVMAVTLPGPVVLLVSCYSWQDALSKLRNLPEPFAVWANSSEAQDAKAWVDEAYAFDQDAVSVRLTDTDYGLHFVAPALL